MGSSARRLTGEIIWYSKWDLNSCLPRRKKRARLQMLWCRRNNILPLLLEVNLSKVILNLFQNLTSLMIYSIRDAEINSAWRYHIIYPIPVSRFQSHNQNISTIIRTFHICKSNCSISSVYFALCFHWIQSRKTISIIRLNLLLSSIAILFYAFPIT